MKLYSFCLSAHSTFNNIYCPLGGPGPAIVNSPDIATYASCLFHLSPLMVVRAAKMKTIIINIECCLVLIVSRDGTHNYHRSVTATATLASHQL